jgi:hypothetical protein
MNKLILFLFFTPITLISQSIDRLSVTCGGFSGDIMNYTIGETFVFSFASSGGFSLESGTASSESYTGGILLTEVSPDKVEFSAIVFPNPVSESIHIYTQNRTKEQLIYRLFDLSGRIVKEIESNESQVEIECTFLPSGLYKLKVIDSFSNKHITINLEKH